MLVIAAIAFFTGYLPRQRQEATIAAEATTEEQAAPRVVVATVEASRTTINWCSPAMFRR